MECYLSLYCSCIYSQLIHLLIHNLDNSSCRILKKKVDDLKIGGCMSEKPVEIGMTFIM